MSLAIWPTPHREWVKDLPVQLGPRKFRLLASAWCRSLIDPAFDTLVSKESNASVVQREVLAALDTHDRFADTGKTKKAMSDAVKKLQTLARFPWPRSVPAHSLIVLLLAKDPCDALNHCTTHMLTSRMVPIEHLLPELQTMVSDLLAPPAVDATLEPSCLTPDVLELAQAIYQQREFARMPALADVLERAGCQNKDVLEHCRTSGAVHIRGCWALDAVLGDAISRPRPAHSSKPLLKRHQILGRELFETRETTFQILERADTKQRERTAPGRPHQQFPRVLQLENAMGYAVLEHLGYGPIDDLARRLHTGVDRAVEYFFGDWWRGDEDDARALDKSRPDRVLAWFGALPHALRLCGLTGRWEEAARISSWFDESIQMEQRFELNDYEYQWLYLCIVSYLRPEPLEFFDVADLLAQLHKARPKRPRLLAAVWEAVLGKEQKEFEKALKESVRHFLATQAENAPNVNFWVALDESLMWLIAERDGLPFPALPEKTEAAIVRRQTVGLVSQ